MTVRFVEAVTQKDRAIQTALCAFGIIRYGGSLTPSEAKTFCDLLSLVLPNKYRFPRETWQQIEMGVTQKLVEDSNANASGPSED